MLSPLNVVGMLALVGLVITVVLRLLGMSWGKGMVAGFVVVPIGLLLAGAMGFAGLTALKRSGVDVGGLLFAGLATVTLAAAFGVALSKNILYSGFFLMGTLVGVAGLYLFIGADFVGIAQMVIYIGGILVLILFAVLLTNRIESVTVSNRSAPIGPAAGVTVFGFICLAMVLIETDWSTVEAVATPSTARLGDAFLREYLLPFELISLVLVDGTRWCHGHVARRAAKDCGSVSKDEAPGPRSMVG